MAKPICVIYVPTDFVIGNGHDGATELMRALNGNFGDEEGAHKMHYTDYWKEYYWFVFRKYGVDAPEFKVYHEKDFTDIHFNELKQLVLDSIEQMNSDTEL